MSAIPNVYVALFELGYNWGIGQWYPVVGHHEQFGSGRVYRIGYQAEDRIAFELPAGIPEVREYLKVIATLVDTDFELRQQGELKTPFERRARALHSGSFPLDQLLRGAMTGSTRGGDQAAGQRP